MNSKFFLHSLRYLEELNNKLNSKRFSKDDFEQLNAFFTFNGLEKNIDLLNLYEKTEELCYQVNEEIRNDVERESSQLIYQYLEHHQAVFFVDDMAYASLSESLKHALTVYHIVQEKNIDTKLFKAYPKLELILSKKNTSDGMINGWYFNNYFYTIEHSIFEYLGVNFDIIKTTDKEFCINAINFIEQVNTYKPGDRLVKITSNWITTRSEKKRWNGTWQDTIVEGEKNKATHGFDWISDSEVIYQKTYGVGLSGGSETFWFKKDLLGNWQKVKSLQKLIR